MIKIFRVKIIFPRKKQAVPFGICKSHGILATEAIRQFTSMLAQRKENIWYLHSLSTDRLLF